MASPEPIAIVGMGCRLPGGSSSPSKLWELLESGKSAYSEIPKSRFNIEGFYNPEGNTSGSVNTRGGYFIDDDVRLFDNDFFGINKIEATYMDPQQRKLLEVVYECLESGGVSIEKVSGANVGCYVGNFTYDFSIMQNRDSEHLHRYSATGLGATILANRISHIFNLQGPSLALDTACSSSLYCLHLACAALDANECDAAIVASANLIQSPEQQLATAKVGVLSPTSTCHTFDASADGYGRGEGVGALYLKKLSKAIVDGNPIRSVIRGTAINSDGKTPGLTLPSATAQEKVIRKAYLKANLGFEDTDYVECHGTGTAVGDPIEVEALSRVFKRLSARPLLIGSIKPNIGHGEAVSGISSVIKATLALEKGQIPPTIGITRTNPKIKLEEWNMKIVTCNTKWPDHRACKTRRASINAFGYGGANAHVILETAGSYLPSCSGDIEPNPKRSKFLLPFSANSKASLEENVSGLSSDLLKSIDVSDLARTLARRSRLSVRGYIHAGHQLTEDIRVEELRRHEEKKIYTRLPIAFVFTGQGAQWPQMAFELLIEFSSFRRTIQELDNVLKALPEAPLWTIEGVLSEPAETSSIHLASRSQPVCTAVQIALVRLLSEWNVKPDAVLGHSSGEICAAYSAGYLSAKAAIVIAYYRGYIVSKLAPKGAMMAAGCSPEDAANFINELGLDNTVNIACINSPESVTFSGDPSSIIQLLAHLQTKQIFARHLKTGNKAYHSHHMSLLGQEYQDFLTAALPLAAEQATSVCTWISSLTGERSPPFISHDYWRNNLQSPVLFSAALLQLYKHANYHIVEIGPHSVLELPIKQTIAKAYTDENYLYYLPTLHRTKSSLYTMLDLAGQLFLHGHDVEFESVNNAQPINTNQQKPEKVASIRISGKQLTDLPSYPWHYTSVLWNESRLSREFRSRQYPYHNLLGSQIPGGSGKDVQWRNMLRTQNVPWLEGHKLDQSIVFPCTGYITMALDAICQATYTTKAEFPSFELANISILKPLVLQNSDDNKGTEIFTTLQPQQISSVRKSDRWWVFEISSFEAGTVVNHANGLISIESHGRIFDRCLDIPQAMMEQHAVRNWYERFTRIGLNFGGSFKSLVEISNARNKSSMQTIAKTKHLPGLDRPGSNYVMHPATIDALLQAAFIASSAGVIKNLSAKIPVTIENAKIRIPPISARSELLTIEASSDFVGPGVIRYSAELCNSEKCVCIQLKGCRAVPYQNQSLQGNSIERHPMLRVIWKPDITKIQTGHEEELTKCLAMASSFDYGLAHAMTEIAAAIDLLVHKNPSMRILEMTYQKSPASKVLSQLLQPEDTFKRCQILTQAHMVHSHDVVVDNSFPGLSKVQESKMVTDVKGSTCEMVIFLESFETMGSSIDSFNRVLDHIRRVLVPAGLLVLRLHVSTVPELERHGFSLLHSAPDGSKAVTVLARSPKDMLTQNGKAGSSAGSDIIMVESNDKHILNDVLEAKLWSITGRNVRRILFSDVTDNTITVKATVISTVELQFPLFSCISSEDLHRIKIITDNASDLIWITGGNLMLGARPDFALAAGLSRAVMVEQPALNFLTFDVDNARSNFDVIASNIAFILDEALHDQISDFEYLQQDGLTYVSRFVPEASLNNIFREKQSGQKLPMELQTSTPCRLAIDAPGQLHSIHFEHMDYNETNLKSNFIEVSVKVVGLNAKDLYVLHGIVDTKRATCSLEYCGVVTRIGTAVREFSPGDRIVVFSPSHFSTIERVPEWACCKLEENEDFQTISTLPTVYSTALYALNDRAHILPGQSILIHSAAGGMGIAAIQVAQLAGAEIFATVGTKEKRNFLVKNFGVKEHHIFNSRDSSFLQGVLKATNGRGVDIVLNSLTGDLLHDSCKAVATFGYFIELGKSDIVNAGKLGMEFFTRNTTFSAFDLSELYNSGDPRYQQVHSRLLAEVMSLYRANKIKAIEPMKVFDVSDITQAYRYLSLGDRIGKVVVSLEDSKSMIPIRPLKFNTILNSEKTYFLVGCLGGLGRSIAKWMVNRGAKKLMFLSRSGLDRLPAKRLVKELERAGVDVAVECGDVSDFGAVKKAVEKIVGPIGGVIQAAMGLDEALFTSMSHEAWHTGIKPKVTGTWNIHNAIQGKDEDLDFFLMTSSVNGSVGIATESNYCAANYFLDMFARYRRNLGLPAISIGLGVISEVGYLHENPEIEELLMRKGVHAIDEDELLQIIDAALCKSQGNPITNYDKLCESHIVTGLEPLGLDELRKKGFEGTPMTLNDSRAALLAGLFSTNVSPSVFNSNGLPSELATAVDSGIPITSAILEIVKKKFSNLLLVAIEDLNLLKPISSYGIDSMLAAVIRTWVYQTFKVDVDLMALLSQSVTIQGLVEIISGGMVLT